MPERAPAGPRISAGEFEEIARRAVPYVGQLGCRIERLEAGRITVRLPYTDLLQRPGGTICGPALMALADIALYGVVMSMIGRVELTVTTDLNFHFLSRPRPVDVIADARILRLGVRLAVGEVIMHSDGDARAICHVVGTYAIPPEAGLEEWTLTAGDVQPR
ncbi:MAG: PaaI family thioesterase [Geminicoccales bacterium]